MPGARTPDVAPAAADRAGGRGRRGGSHPAAVGAERPRRALPGPAGRRGERRRAGQRRREGRGHRLRGEGRAAADPRVLPGRGGARGRSRRVPSEKQCATSRDGRLPPPTNVQATEAPGGFNVVLDRQRPERAHRARRRRAGRRGEPGGGQERHGARAGGPALHHGGGEARADAVVAAERPAGVRGADGPALRRGDRRGRGRGCGRCRDGGAAARAVPAAARRGLGAGGAVAPGARVVAAPGPAARPPRRVRPRWARSWP